MRVIYSARSHMGYARGGNEDNLFVGGFTLPVGAESRPFSLDGMSPGPTVLAVCDGMGGETNGAIASRIAVQALLACNGAMCNAKPEELSDLVSRYVCQTQESIQAQTPGKRAGTTLALAVAHRQGVFCYNLGDTRIYQLQKGTLLQITDDHTLGAQLRRQGILPASQIGGKNPDHVLTRCIGIGAVQPPQTYPPIRGSCRLLLCSDGLTRMVEAPVIRQTLLQSETPALAADLLISLALKKGGRDNITAVVADLQTGFQELLSTLRSRKRRARS